MNRALLKVFSLVALLMLARGAAAEDATRVRQTNVETRRSDAPGLPSDASVDGPRGETDGAYGDASDVPAVLGLHRETNQIRDLMAGRLSTSVEPGALFDVSLADEDAVRVDAERLQALLRDVDDEAPTRSRGAHARRRDAASEDAGLYAPLWKARIDLDRARLAFYQLSPERRHALVSAHQPAVADAAAVSTQARLGEKEDQDERKSALRAAQEARTAAERLVASELARLLDVERAQSKLEASLAVEEKNIDEPRDVAAGWEQRAKDALSGSGQSADDVYDGLRGALRLARAELARALDTLERSGSDVPGPGPSLLTSSHASVDTTTVDEERDRLVAKARRLRTDEETVRRARAGRLFDEIDVLNGERLALLDALSPHKRSAVTGFTRAGWDQAVSEARQLTLILRYHRYLIEEWLLTLRHPGRALERALAGGALHALEWLLAFTIFFGWRRRSTALLIVLYRRSDEEDRRTRLPKASLASRLLGFLTQVHRPLEWLLLLVILRWLLPESTQSILEVRVLAVLMMWVFGAALIVDTVNALAGAGRKSRLRGEDAGSAALRLRSLRLVARVVVVFGLILVISTMLVGRGTIYEWVFSTCWLASLPLLLVLIRWWREIVFVRTQRARKPAPIQRWVLANRRGWRTSFIAATVGGLYLFVSGTARAARNWVGRFVITRRALAYLFRRQLDKREQTGAPAPISARAFDVLGPEQTSSTWIPVAADEPLRRVAERIRARKGGVVALVGERGMGKSSALRRLRGDVSDMVPLDAPSSDLQALARRFAETVGLSPGASFAESAAALAAGPLHGVALDNAHRFVRPVVGGLATFDELLAAARRHASTTTWVFAFDRAIWRFLERSRGARPNFDEVIILEPWAEEQIATLLRSRTEAAGLAPSFEGLLAPMPTTADDVDKQDALTQRAADFYRLLWDAATGNPGVALGMWRRSLGTDIHGQTVVRLAAALDTTDLEGLPDSSVFVLRAVLQLAPVRAEEIAEGSILRLADVAAALRYAAARGYVEERDGGFRITWTWFRAITLFLQRRHLLITR